MKAEGTLAYNGEIYNFSEIRKNLKKNNIVFESDSDTEVLLKGLDHHGSAILNELNGMFAFAYYRQDTKELLLARDRFGVKPLYYTIDNGILYFSSEISPLVSISSSLTKNLTFFNNFIKHTATDYDRTTQFNEILQVERGSFVSFKQKKKEVVKWYKEDDFKFDRSIFSNKERTINYYEELLTDAIKLRLRADVPVCLTLSGGLDSATLEID